LFSYITNSIINLFNKPSVAFSEFKPYPWIAFAKPVFVKTGIGGKVGELGSWGVTSDFSKFFELLNSELRNYRT